ncbi:MAG: hypothetical protein R3C59_17645 [Planctomycetaceae bacterium]
MDTAEPLESTPRQRWWILLCVAAILLPWLSILVAHYVGNGNQATGFIQYDQPYYVANGRAAFERGNGFLYPNPSDASADAPAIYFHWLPWLLGILVARIGLEPGMAYSLLTAGMLPVFGWLTWQLVQRRSTLHRLSLMVLAVWGGGVLSLLGLLRGAATGLSITDGVFEFDPTEGLWFLNWGRNTIYGIEITYHCFVATTWLLIMQRRHGWALLCSGILAMTHPWSGLELLLMVNAWLLLNSAMLRTGRSMVDLGIAMLLIVLLLGYYKVWLPTFPSHAALQHNWSLNWRAEWSTVLYAYGPIGMLAMAQLSHRGFRPTEDEKFLLVSAAVAFGLSIHDRILPKAVQPLHFTRGYVWMPLFLIAVPTIVRMLTSLTELPHLQRRMIVTSLFLFACFDNIAFVATHSYWQFTASGPEGFYLTADDRDVLQTVQHEGKDRIVFCESLDLSYLMPTYAPVRPWLCHKFNTPDYVDRQKELHHAILNNAIDPSLLPPDIQMLVLARDRDAALLDSSVDWKPVAKKNGKWQVWKRDDVHVASQEPQTKAFPQ